MVLTRRQIGLRLTCIVPIATLNAICFGRTRPSGRLEVPDMLLCAAHGQSQWDLLDLRRERDCYHPAAADSLLSCPALRGTRLSCLPELRSFFAAATYAGCSSCHCLSAEHYPVTAIWPTTELPNTLPVLLLQAESKCLALCLLLFSAHGT